MIIPHLTLVSLFPRWNLEVTFNEAGENDSSDEAVDKVNNYRWIFILSSRQFCTEVDFKHSGFQL